MSKRVHSHTENHRRRNRSEKLRKVSNHSQTGGHRGKDKSAWKKETSDQRQLTFWKAQKRQVRTVKANKQGSYSLENTEAGASQHTKECKWVTGTHTLEASKVESLKGRRWACKKHSLPELHRGRDKSGQWKGKWAKGSHFLESANGGVSQDNEGKQKGEGHSPAEKCGGRDES